MKVTLANALAGSLLAGVFVTMLVAPAYGAHSVVVFDNGGPLGTVKDVSDSDNGSVAIVLGDGDLTDNVTSLQLDKTFDRYTTQGGGPLPPTGLPLLVQFDLPSAQDVGAAFFDIQFSDEQVRNSTDTPWWDFEMILIHDHLQGDILNEELVSLGSIFTEAELFGELSVRLYGGMWPNDGVFRTLFQSAGGSPLTIRVVLEDEPITFLLKERPSIPEPATMALLGLGGVIGLIRRRR